MSGSISVAHMSNRTAKPTAQDVQAAAKLKARWDIRDPALGLTQDTMAAELGITQGAVSQYLNGKIPMNYRTLVTFCRALGIDETEIRTDLPEQGLRPVHADLEWPNVVSYGQGAAMGEGAAAIEYAESNSLKFKASSLRRKGLNAENLAVFYGTGDSMLPRIRDGDAILFDRADTKPKDDAIFVVRYDGHIYAKRLQKIGKQWVLTSDNRENPKWRKPIAIDEHMDFEIIGRVRWVGSWED